MKRRVLGIQITALLLATSLVWSDQAVVSRYMGTVIPAITTFLSGLKTSRITTSGSAPSCSSTGTGASATCAVATGSTDAAGIITISAAGIPAALGTVTLTFTTRDGGYGTNGTSCTATLMDGSTAWNTRATIITNASAALTTSHVWKWDNNAVALGNGSTYLVEYSCFGR